MWVYHHDDPFDRAMHQDTSATQSDADVGSKADVAAAEPPQKRAKLQEDLLIAGGLE